MNPSAEIAAYIASVMTNVTTKVTVDSITPVDVGDMGTDLADLILPYLEAFNNYGITGGTTVPDDADGEDLDQYYRINGSTFYIYRKVAGVWVPQVTLSFGITFPDGPLINLRVSVDGFDTVVTPGGWVISNVIYEKLTQTAFAIPAADLNFPRYDLIYANTSGDVLYLAGTAASSPSFPATPANSIVVDYIVVPSSSSGASPYSYYGGSSGAVAVPKTFSLTQADIANTGDPYDDQYIIVPTIAITNVMSFWINSSQYGGKNTWFTPIIYEQSSGVFRLKGFPNEDFTIIVNYI